MLLLLLVLLLVCRVDGTLVLMVVAAARGIKACFTLALANAACVHHGRASRGAAACGRAAVVAYR